MSPSSYTEDILVQQTTAEYLEHQLGWESIYAYNNDDFGPDSLLGRAFERWFWKICDGIQVRRLEKFMSGLGRRFPIIRSAGSSNCSSRRE